MSRLVVIESPYAGDVEANVEYARACVRDCGAAFDSDVIAAVVARSKS